MDRRSLLRGLGLGVGASVVPTVSVAVGISDPHKPPIGGPVMMMSETEPKPANSGSFYLCPMKEDGRKVGLSVGGDGCLWLQIDGKWQRVLTTER